jgi:three-Cys-motif partner protein
MKNSFQHRVYVDVMAGPGICKIRETGEEVEGSPLIALRHEFTRYVFIEADPKLAEALEFRVSKHPKAKQAKVICADWAEEARAGRLQFSGLVVAFLDPTGIAQAPWQATECLLRANSKIDLLTTLQYAMGITLNLYQYIESKPEQITALDKFLGESDWRQWERPPTDSAFTERVLSRYTEKFSQLGFQGSRQITVEANGKPLYRLALFSRHPKADEFWRKIIGVDENGQREFDLS